MRAGCCEKKLTAQMIGDAMISIPRSISSIQRRRAHPTAPAFIEAARQMGFPILDDITPYARGRYSNRPKSNISAARYVRVVARKS